jgi:predicted metal-dependent peptidase
MSAVPVKWEDLPKQIPAAFVKPKGDEFRRLKIARTALIINSPFFGLLALRLEIVEAPWIITAGTDGRRFFYNPAYIAGLTDAQLRGLWGHEVMHCSSGHIWRLAHYYKHLKGEELHRIARKTNIAADYAIDQLLQAAELDVPNPLVYKEWKGYTAEKIFPLLPEPPKQPGGGGVGVATPGGKPGEGDPRAPGYMPDKDVLLLPTDEKGAPTEDKQLASEWKQATASALQAAKMQGKLPANLEIMIGDLIAPRVPWKDVMRRFVQQTAAADFTWRKPSNRYMAAGMYLPKVESEQLPPIALGWDTSGSHIDEHTQRAVASETTEIILEVRPEKLDIYYFDAAIQGHQVFEQGDAMKKFQPRGGGGTDFRPVFDAIEKSGETPACLIMVTDCYGTFPKEGPEYPVLWASTVKPEKLGSYTPPFGEVVYVDIE